MQIVSNGTAFNFSYPAFNMASNLFVQASIYDVTTGTPSLVSTVAMTDTAFGVYSGDFSGQSGKVYLVIALVYTDGTYSTIDTTYAPWADSYSLQAPVSLLAFNYGAFDQATGLYIQTNVYDVTSGINLTSQVRLSLVLGGVYFGAYTGSVPKSYMTATAVYTDNTYMVIDTTRAPASNSFQTFNLGGGTTVTNLITNASLMGQSLAAILKET